MADVAKRKECKNVPNQSHDNRSHQAGVGTPTTRHRQASSSPKPVSKTSKARLQDPSQPTPSSSTKPKGSDRQNSSGKKEVQLPPIGHKAGNAGQKPSAQSSSPEPDAVSLRSPSRKPHSQLFPSAPPFDTGGSQPATTLANRRSMPTEPPRPQPLCPCSEAPATSHGSVAFKPNDAAMLSHRPYVPQYGGLTDRLFYQRPLPPTLHTGLPSELNAHNVVHPSPRERRHLQNMNFSPPRVNSTGAPAQPGPPSPALSRSRSHSFNGITATSATIGTMDEQRTFTKKVAPAPTTLTTTFAFSAREKTVAPAPTTLTTTSAFSAKEKTVAPAPTTVTITVAAASRDVAACGLKNLGNTCYMNSVIQVLRHIFELNESLLRFCASAKPKPDSLLKSYSDLVREMQDPGVQSPTSLRSFKATVDRKCPRFSGYDQQDATEFMRLLVNEMNDEWKALLPPTQQIPNPKDWKTADATWEQLINAERTDIAYCFMGMLKSTIQCQTCQNGAVKFDPFWDLFVPLPKKSDSLSVVQLEECLDQFTKEEILDKDDKPYCEKCTTKTTSVKQLTLQKQPRVMVIILKRFAQSKFGTISKVDTTVSVPFTLDMNKYATNKGAANTKYTLFAVINHVGTDRFGHYTAWCKNEVEWNLFNDSRVTKAPPPPQEGSVKTKDAYALFFRSVDSDVV